MERLLNVQPSLAAKMAAAAKEIGFGVPKDGKNDQQRYRFTSAAAVKIRAGLALAAQGIAVSSKAEVLCSDYIETKSGGKMRRHLVKVTLTFTDGDSDIVSEGLGEGSDSLDKAVMKAFTAAEKYAYIAAFSLAMGEDPEWDEDSADERRPEQRREVDEERFQNAVAGTRQSEGPREELRAVKTAEALEAWTRKHLAALARLPPEAKREAMADIMAKGAEVGLADRDVRALLDAAKAGT